MLSIWNIKFPSSLLWSDLCQGVKRFFLSLNLKSHLLSDSIWKEPDLTVHGMWPLCYSWIGYLQANGPPRALLSKSVDHGFTCAHRIVADNSNLEVITALFRYCQIFALLLAEICSPMLISACPPTTSWAVGCQERKPLLRCAALLTDKWQWCFTLPAYWYDPSSFPR